MKLRRWQSNCLTHAFTQYCNGQPHFLCLATPGAGKTLMAAQLGRRLFSENLIDLVICFSPSVVVANDFRTELSLQIGKRFDGTIGAAGMSLTYQAMLMLDAEFWKLFDHYRVFVIFDEIHHCAGHDVAHSNAWGQRIIASIKGKAAFTLALSGTPWRSDRFPISLANYCDKSRQIICDYRYGLKEAIQDGVCRIPKITLIDNDDILFKTPRSETRYSSFANLLNESNCTYQNLVESDALIRYMIAGANRKLSQLRKHHSDAGGLIVASSVAHAMKIQKILADEIGEHSTVATYYSEDAPRLIEQFKFSAQKWIISVGMISEGTNIPRLRVCCHLSRIKTELHFRQVLGRILRASGTENEQGFFYIPADPTLIEFARNVGDDLPSEPIIDIEYVDPHLFSAVTQGLQAPPLTQPDPLVTNGTAGSIEIQAAPGQFSLLAEAYEATLNLFGRFKADLLALEGF